MSNKLKEQFNNGYLNTIDVVKHLMNYGFKSDKLVEDTSVDDLYNKDGYIQSVFITVKRILILVY